MNGHPDESWAAWTHRIAGELAALGAGDWLTFTVHVESTASAAYAAQQAPKKWRHPFSQSASTSPSADVFVQARLLEGVIAVECIADTEFEGLTELTAGQQAALRSLGWDDGDEPDYARTFAPEDAEAAADLIAHTLSDVLRAENPSRVDVRRRDPH